jgi:pimeloyl-ACP methyl ester carboxylesterase
VLGTLALLAAACGESGVETERADAAVTPSTGAPVTDPSATDPPGTEAPSSTTDSEGSAPSNSPTLEWEEFDEGVETARLEVPVDYEDPDGPTFELFLLRRPADDQDNKIGSLLVNPGGPGFSGAELAFAAEQAFGEPLLERFDIIGWDPRGAGLSEPAVDCIDDYDRYFASADVTPDDDAERQVIIDLAEEFTDACEDANGDILPYIGTNNSARDIDSIRRALGEDKISYFGFSYGSELGATWATLFPDTVRAAVLDGAVDPNADPLEGSIQQAQGFEGTLTTYLAQCSADPECAFHNGGDAEGAFDALMRSLDESPIPSEPGRPDVNLSVMRQAYVQAMYDDSFWPQLSEALADAQNGDGAGLLALYDAYYQRYEDGTWGNELEAFQAIECADRIERPTVEQSDADALIVNEAAPRVSPFTTGDYFCTFFPDSIDPRVDITGAGAGPIVVVGTTGDAATPLESTRKMAAALEDGRLIIVTADQHTGYGVNDCVSELVDNYLVDLEIPPAESEC